MTSKTSEVIALGRTSNVAIAQRRYAVRAVWHCAGRVVISCLAVACFQPALAYGQAASQLHWQAADGCPDAAAGRRAIEELLAPRGVVAWPADVSVTIGTSDDRRWQARVAIHDRTGISERRVDGAECAAVADAAALVVAMALETIAAEASAEKPARSPPPTAAASARDETVGWILGARAALDFGSVPLPGVGLGVTLGVQIAEWTLTVDATGWLPRLAAAPSVEISAVTAGMRGCYAALQIADMLALEPCVSAEAGLASARGVNVLDAVTQHALWAAGFAGLTLRQNTSAGLVAWLALDFGVPLFRPNYTVADLGVVFRAEPVVGRAAIGLGWTFR